MSCRQALQERELPLGQRQPAVGALRCYQCSAASLPCAVALRTPLPSCPPTSPPLPPSLCFRGKPLVQPHHLRSPAQLVAVVKMVILAAGIAAVHPGADSYIQCCLLILLFGCERDWGWLGVALFSYLLVPPRLSCDGLIDVWACVSLPFHRLNHPSSTSHPATHHPPILSLPQSTPFTCGRCAPTAWRWWEPLSWPVHSPPSPSAAWPWR